LSRQAETKQRQIREYYALEQEGILEKEREGFEAVAEER
jgi:hypothetical protein